MRVDRPPEGPPSNDSPANDPEVGALLESEIDPDPFVQFNAWFHDAQTSGLSEPEAMTLATVDPDGQPAARVVLLKGHDSRGYVFFTNYDSRKGKDLKANPRVALVFHWDTLRRQVRIEGVAHMVAAAESDAYFQSRPRGSRIAAAASSQSEPVANHDELHRIFAEHSARFDGKEIPRPPHWGGYRVVPHHFEFWQGRRDRFHDRIAYRRGTDGAWLRERLFP